MIGSIRIWKRRILRQGFAKHPCGTGQALVLFLLALAFVAGCSLFQDQTRETGAPPTATVRPTAIGTPPGTSVPTNNPPSVTPSSEGPLRLVVWTSEDYAPNSETEGGIELLQQIQAFQRERNIGIEVILKKRNGPGGLLDFLTTASTAAPSILPDLVTLSDEDLYQAVQAGLLQPLDDLVSADLLEDQFDFAKALTRFGDTTMGVLYQADVQHLVYNTSTMEQAPLSWRLVYSSTAPFVFSPAASSARVNNAILVQYLAAGGQLANAEGQTTINVERLTAALEVFALGRRAGVIPESVLTLTDAATAWAVYRIGEAGMVQVPASIYLAERAELNNAGFGPQPAGSTDTVTVGQGWALALVTADPERQQLAAALIEHLMSPENSGAWTWTAGRAPTRAAALDNWPSDDPYVPFLRSLLVHAEAVPPPPVAAVASSPLTEALIQVLSGQATAAEAAEAAAITIEELQ